MALIDIGTCLDPLSLFLSFSLPLSPSFSLSLSLSLSPEIGVENLCGSGLIAGETSRAYREGFTLSYVTGRTVGIGSYLVRLGQRWAFLFLVSSSFLSVTCTDFLPPTHCADNGFSEYIHICVCITVSGGLGMDLQVYPEFKPSYHLDWCSCPQQGAGSGSVPLQQRDWWHSHHVWEWCHSSGGF